MKTLDLQIRMARKMASGKGSMQLTQSDLDVLVHSGAYAALCEAATQELKGHRPTSVGAHAAAMQNQPISIRGFEVPDEVSAAVARAKLISKHPIRPRSTAPILPALIKSSERR